MATGEKATAVSEVPNGEAERFQAVVNDEEQYSIWPAHKPAPAGWRSAGCEGTREAVLAYIEETWTDMRPLSVRRRLAGEG
jgi:MbtH protein